MQKFLRTLMLMAVMLLPFASQAQNTLTVADGTATNSNVPIHGLWADAYLRCQTIYPAGEIASAALTYGMNGASITSITYYMSSPAAEAWTGTWEVKMMEVTASTLTGFLDMTNATTVYTGTLDGTSSPMTINFTTPYTYQGGNLLIEVSEIATGNYKSITFYGANASAASWQGYNSTSWSAITGAVKDFIPKTTFTFTGGSQITCRPVSGLTVDAAQTTSNSLTLTWTDTMNAGATYSIYDMSDNTLIVSGVTCSTYTVTGLNANTQYTFGVVADCSPTDASSAMTISGRTNCAAEVLPFVETFDATLSSNQCWRGANNATAAQVFSGTALTLTSLSSWTYASSARDSLEAGHYYKNVYGTNQKAWMITPAIDLTNVSSAQLSFDVALTDYNNAALPDVNGDTNNSQAFMVIVSTDGGNTWSANNATIWQNEGGDYTYASLASTTYQNKVIDLTQYVGNTIKIAFYTQSIWTGGDNDLHIDNIAVTQASSCPAPVVTVDNFMNRTVSFSWTSTADSVIVGLFNNDGQQIAGWFAPATGSITNYNLPETYFPFGVGYVVAQSICGDYADNNLSSVAYDVFAVTCNEEEQCPVTFMLTDAYGDGWNGGALDIYDTVSGLIVGSMACPDYGVQDSSVTYTTTYSFCPGRVYSIVYRSGQYDDEVSFTILGPDSTVYGSFSNPTAGVLGYFTHTCPATGCVAETFPFSEDFEDGVLSECWTIDGPGNWTVGTGDYSSSTGAHTGTYNAKITHGNTGDATKLISPVINMTGVANAELRFWHVQRSWAGDIDQLAVYYRTSATGDWQNLATYTGAFATWTEEVISLPNLSSTYQVAFEMTDSYGYGVAIDDITIDLPPACAAVTALTASAVTNNSITLEWTDANNTGATYTVYEVNPTGETLLASNISGTTYTVINLTGHTSYTFGVVANCTADASSTMATLAVTTMPDPIMCGDDEALTFSNADNVTGTTSYYPGYSYYNYSYSEVIIPLTRLIGLGEIKGMEYYVNSIAEGSSYFNNCEIYLMNTTATSLTDGFIQDSNNFQLVYSGDLNQTETGWKLVTFDTSFMYDGASNLLVAVRRNHGSYASSGSFGSYTADAQLARYVYRDASAYEIGTITGGTAATNVPVYHMIGCAGNAPDCMPISNLTASDLTTTSVTLNWVDNNNTGATYTVYNDNNVVASGITTTTYNVTGLTAETNYNFSVVANCTATAESMPISISVFTGYCAPTPTSVDGSGITSVAFGGMTNTTSHAGSTAAYVNNSTMAGSVPAGTTATVDITFATGYTYGTIIWVDWDNSLTFEGNEVVYVGTSENSNPTTLTATFDIPATQANGNYRMRILAADSYFDSYTGSIEAAANANPCASYSWGVAEDYTLLVGDAPSCLAVTDLTVSNATANTVTLTWTDALNTGATYSVYEVNATGETLVASNISGTTYTVTGLSAITSYTFGVVANCSATDASTMATISAATDCAGGSCNIFIYAQDSYGDGWNGNTIDVMQGLVTAGSYTMPGQGVSSTVIYDTAVVSVCAGQPISFSWTTGQWADEVTFSIANASGEIVYTGYGSDMTNGTFLTIDSCNVAGLAPDTTTVTIAVNDATMGTVTPAPGTYQLVGDEAMTITATPNSGYHFLHWEFVYTFSGVLDTTTISDNPISVSEVPYLSPMTFTAIFEQDAVCNGTTCDLVITGSDEWGDGWNGGSLNVLQNNVLVNSFAVTDSADTVSIEVCSDYPVDFSWTSGSWDSEVSFSVSTLSGTEIFSVSTASILTDGEVFATVSNPCTNPVVTYSVDSFTVTLAVNDATMGTTIPAPGVYQVSPLDVMTVVATPNAGYYFQGWAYSYNYDGVVYYDTVFSATYDTLNIEGDYWAEVEPVTFTALFTDQQYVGDSMLVNIYVNDPTMGTTNPAPGAHYFYEGETCSVVAMPYPGYMIEGWYVMALEDGDTVIDEYVPYPFTDVFEIFEEPFVVGPGYGDIEFYVTAHFTEDTSTSQEEYLTFITAVNDATMGTVTPEPGTHYYYLGDVINFSATPYEGYHAESADITVYLMGIPLIDSTVSLGNMTTFDLEVEEIFLGATISITVNFASGELEEAILNVDVNNANMGYVLVNGEQTATYVGAVGETVTLEAVANNGFAFQSWSDGNTSANRDLVLYDAVTSITANFIQNEGIDIAGMLNDLKVYPNPTHGIVNIDAEDVVKVEVMDLNGRVAAVYENSNRVDLSDLNAGTYMLRIQTTNGTAVRRVVKK